MGFGKHSILHTEKILRLSEDLPMVIEIVDSLEKIESFLPLLDEMIKDGLVTLETVKVIHYKARHEVAVTPTPRDVCQSDSWLERLCSNADRSRPEGGVV